MNGLHILNQLHEEIKDVDAIWSISELYKQMKANGMSTAHAIKLLEISNNDIPSVESIIRERKREEANLDFRIHQAAKTFQDFNDSILKEKMTLEHYRWETRRSTQELAHVDGQKTKLENVIKDFQSNNETYLKIKHIVKQEIEHIMTSPSRLLRFVLASIFESARRHPGTFQSMYYNMSTADIQSLLRTSISQNENNSNQHNQNEDVPDKILLDEAEQILNRIVETLVNRYINEITNDTSQLQVPNVPSVDEGRSTAITVFTNDVPYEEAESNILSSPSLYEDHHTIPNRSEDGISISEICSNWAKECVKSLGGTNERASNVVTSSNESGTEEMCDSLDLQE